MTKIVDGAKDRDQRRRYENEVLALRAMRGSANVVQMQDACWVDAADMGAIVLPFAKGGDLYDHLLRCYGNGMDDDALRVVMRRIVGAMASCRDAGLVHNDIKPENVLLMETHRVQDLDRVRNELSAAMDDAVRRGDDDETEKNNFVREGRRAGVRATLEGESRSVVVQTGMDAARRAGPLHGAVLCDFGLATKSADANGDGNSDVAGVQAQVGEAGTLRYLAPEARRNETPRAAWDVWSAGVVLFVLAFAEFPWHDAIDSESYRTYADLEARGRGIEFVRAMASSRGGRVRDECVRVMHGMLRVDPDKRTPLSSLESDPWLMNE